MEEQIKCYDNKLFKERERKHHSKRAQVAWRLVHHLGLHTIEIANCMLMALGHFTHQKSLSHLETCHHRKARSMPPYCAIILLCRPCHPARPYAMTSSILRSFKICSSSFHGSQPIHEKREILHHPKIPAIQYAIQYVYLNELEGLWLQHLTFNAKTMIP